MSTAPLHPASFACVSFYAPSSRSKPLLTRHSFLQLQRLGARVFVPLAARLRAAVLPDSSTFYAPWHVPCRSVLWIPNRCRSADVWFRTLQRAGSQGWDRSSASASAWTVGIGTQTTPLLRLHYSSQIQLVPSPSGREEHEEIDVWPVSPHGCKACTDCQFTPAYSGTQIGDGLLRRRSWPCMEVVKCGTLAGASR